MVVEVDQAMKPQSMTQHLVRLISLLILSLPGSSFRRGSPDSPGPEPLGSHWAGAVAGAAYDVASSARFSSSRLPRSRSSATRSTHLAAEDKKHGGGGVAERRGWGLALWLTRLVRRISLDARRPTAQRTRNGRVSRGTAAADGAAVARRAAGRYGRRWSCLRGGMWTVLLLLLFLLLVVIHSPIR